jgi:hypothetical protein
MWPSPPLSQIQIIISPTVHYIVACFISYLLPVSFLIIYILYAKSCGHSWTLLLYYVFQRFWSFLDVVITFCFTVVLSLLDVAVTLSISVIVVAVRRYYLHCLCQRLWSFLDVTIVFSFSVVLVILGRYPLSISVIMVPLRCC